MAEGGNPTDIFDQKFKGLYYLLATEKWLSETISYYIVYKECPKTEIIERNILSVEYLSRHTEIIFLDDILPRLEQKYDMEVDHIKIIFIQNYSPCNTEGNHTKVKAECAENLITKLIKRFPYVTLDIRFAKLYRCRYEDGEAGNANRKGLCKLAEQKNFQLRCLSKDEMQILCEWNDKIENQEADKNLDDVTNKKEGTKNVQSLVDKMDTLDIKGKGQLLKTKSLMSIVSFRTLMSSVIL